MCHGDPSQAGNGIQSGRCADLARNERCGGGPGRKGGDRSSNAGRAVDERVRVGDNIRVAEHLGSLVELRGHGRNLLQKIVAAGKLGPERGLRCCSRVSELGSQDGMPTRSRSDERVAQLVNAQLGDTDARTKGAKLGCKELRTLTNSIDGCLPRGHRANRGVSKETTGDRGGLHQHKQGVPRVLRQSAEHAQ